MPYLESNSRLTMLTSIRQKSTHSPCTHHEFWGNIFSQCKKCPYKSNIIACQMAWKNICWLRVTDHVFEVFVIILFCFKSAYNNSAQLFACLGILSQRAAYYTPCKVICIPYYKKMLIRPTYQRVPLLPEAQLTHNYGGNEIAQI